jgi:hypothetical protein
MMPTLAPAMAQMSEQDRLRACVDLDRQIASVDASAYGTIVELKTRRNTFASTARLPPEILSAIFESIIALGESEFHSGGLQWMHLMEVCRHWRSVMLESPRLWSSLAFHSVRLTSEMLRRSKTSPLVIKVNLTYAEEKRGAVALALSHISRIGVPHINIQFYATDYSKRLLAALDRHAPLLTSLRLSTLRDPRHAHVIPRSLFAPRLRHLAIYNLTISWDLPLLAGLTHLEIGGSPHAPSLGELRAVLSHCPALHTLILLWNLPDTKNQQHQLQDPIPLPTLACLHLNGPVADCDVVVRSLSFPPTTAVMLHCNLSVDISAELPHLLSGLGARRGDGVSIGCLEIRAIYENQIKFEAMTGTNHNTLEHPSLEPTFHKDFFDDEVLSASLVHTTCEGLSPTKILNAEFCLPFRTNSRRWMTMLGSLKNLQVLKATSARNSNVKGLISALKPRLIKVKKKFRPSNVFLPHLRELTLSGAFIRDGSGFKTLRDCCRLRQNGHSEIQILRLLDHTPLDLLVVVVKLKEFVVDVDCTRG